MEFISLLASKILLNHIQEINNVNNSISLIPINTIYFGGGAEVIYINPAEIIGYRIITETGIKIDDSEINYLEQKGIIDRYVALVKPDRVGLLINVFIQVTLERQVEKVMETFEAKMEAYPEVMECYLMTGNSDYLIRLLVSDIKTLEAFIVQKLSTIDGVLNIQSSFALKQVKYKTELPINSD